MNPATIASDAGSDASLAPAAYLDSPGSLGGGGYPNTANRRMAWGDGQLAQRAGYTEGALKYFREAANLIPDEATLRWQLREVESTHTMMAVHSCLSVPVPVPAPAHNAMQAGSGLQQQPSETKCLQVVGGGLNSRRPTSPLSRGGVGRWV